MLVDFYDLVTLCNNLFLKKYFKIFNHFLWQVPETKNVPVSPTGIESILSLVLGIGLIVYSFTTGLENMWNPKYSPFSGCYTLFIGSLLVVSSTRSSLLGLFVGFLMACAAIIYLGEVIDSMPPLMR